jgi:quinol monooxygenase YgiN
MVIVIGSYEFEPGERDAYLAGRHDRLRQCRSEPGCLEFLCSADPLNPGRVIIVEHWASEELLDAHVRLRAELPPAAVGPRPKAGYTVRYRISGSGSGTPYAQPG